MKNLVRGSLKQESQSLLRSPTISESTELDTTSAPVPLDSFLNQKTTIIGNLLDYAATGELEKVNQLLEKHESLVNMGDYDRRTALHLASSEGRLEVVELLLKKGANVHVEDRWGGTPLDDAIRENHEAVVTVLKSAGSSSKFLASNSKIVDGTRTSSEADGKLNDLLDASAKGNLREVQAICEENLASIHHRDYDRRTALHLAASEGQDEVVSYLLKCSKSRPKLLESIINAQDRWGGTPLSDAIREGHTSVAKLLVEFGAREESSRPRFNRKSIVAVQTAVLDSRAKKEMWKIDRSEIEVSDAKRFAHGAGGSLFKAKWRGLNVCVKTLHKNNFKSKANKARMNVDVLAGVTQLSTPQRSLSPSTPQRSLSPLTPLRSPSPSPPNTPDGSTELNSAFQDLMNEIAILSTLRHPSLVLFLGACFDEMQPTTQTLITQSLTPTTKVSKSNSPMLVTEFMPGGNLREVLYKQAKLGKSLPLSVINRWTLQFALGMNFLHRCVPPIIHRDLKPENLLFTSEDINTANLKIADFGLGKVFRSETERLGPYRMTGGTGSYRYMAPEVFMHSNDGIYTYDEKVDVYSWALIVWSMYSGERPFNTVTDGIDIIKSTANPTSASASIVRPPISIVPAKMVDLITSAWSQQPQHRPSFSEIVFKLESNEKEEKNKALTKTQSCCILS